MGDAKNDDLRVSFDSRLRVKFIGSQVTTDAGLHAYREIDKVHQRQPLKELIIDLDSSVSETYGKQEVAPEVPDTL